jgi:hypothetical protein
MYMKQRSCNGRGARSAPFVMLNAQKDGCALRTGAHARSKLTSSWIISGWVLAARFPCWLARPIANKVFLPLVDQRQLLAQVLADLLGLSSTLFPCWLSGAKGHQSSFSIGCLAFNLLARFLFASWVFAVHYFFLVSRGQRPPKFFLHWMPIAFKLLARLLLASWIFAAHNHIVKQPCQHSRKDLRRSFSLVNQVPAWLSLIGWPGSYSIA